MTIFKMPAKTTVAGLVLAAIVITPALAGHHEKDHERALRALEKGEVLPLTKILSIVMPEINGEIVETEFEREDGKWIYEIKYISRDGIMMEVEIDAKTGNIIVIKED